MTAVTIAMYAAATTVSGSIRRSYSNIAVIAPVELKLRLSFSDYVPSSVTFFTRFVRIWVCRVLLLIAHRAIAPHITEY